MRSKAVIALLLFIGWSLPGLLAASVNAALYPVILQRNSAWVYFLAQMGTWWPWAILTPAIVWTVRRFPLKSWRTTVWPHALLLAFSLVVFVACSAAWSVFGQANESPRNAETEPYLRLFLGYMGSRIPVGVILYAAIAGLTTAVDERARLRADLLQTANLRAELARAQLQALQMQLQPHFLFNTLHAISILIEEQPTVASQTLIRLADLLRQTLALADVPEITLGRELEILGGYLEIEMTRFGARLAVTVDVPSALRALLVPSFILQPVVENAVRHGIAPRLKRGVIAIRAMRTGDTLVLEVEDDGPGFGIPTEDIAASAGLGLSATRERLAVRYGNASRVTCARALSGGARVVIEFPVANV
jgi:two-component system LytT family sensor kinase